MVQIIFIGLAAGIAAALLLASFASGSLLSIVLFYLAPLPVMIAALGWSHIAGLLAALVAATALAAAFGGLFFVAFLIAVGLPAWWLSYLTLLARPAGGAAVGGPAAIEWYPVGRLVIWGALLGTVVVASAVLSFGFDAAGFRIWLRRAFEIILRGREATATGAPLELPGISDPNQFLDLLVVAIPPTAASVSTLTSLGNLWLAARIVKVSGRLKRPWPELAAMAFPRGAAALLAVAVVGMIVTQFVGDVSGMIGLIAGVLCASLLMAYTILGLAVLHAITRGIRGRGLLLAGTYASVAVLGWPALLMTAVGLADVALDLRGRIARKRGPPSPLA
jgi:hypothetical protein